MSAHTELEILRIFINENQKHGRRLLYEAIVEEARKRGLIGAIVSRGIMGFWKFGPISTWRILDLSSDLPISIEIAGEHEQVAALLTDLDAMVKEGLVILDKVQVVINRDDKE